jgi:signal transduction histidine kinase/CheY-like chemotaxis protein
MRRYTKRYATYGALFGLAFPLFSTIVDAFMRLDSAGAWIEAQRTNPLLWVIDTAPLFLGFFAALAGRAQDDLSESLESLQSAHTKLESASEKLRAQSESLQTALDTKSQFLARMSHELRTPLNVIIGFTRIVLERAGDELSKRPKRHLGMVLDSGEQLLHLVNDILDLERLDAGRISVDRSTTDVAALLESIHETSAPAVEAAGLTSRVTVPKEGLWMDTDIDRLRQIVTNLVNNSVKYAEKGDISITASVEEENIKIVVADTGVGIPKAALEHIFDPFHQVDNSSARSKDGTGLGLAIVQKLAELLDGKVEVESDVDEGAAFTVTFPKSLQRDPPSGSDKERLAKDFSGGMGKGEVILVVDDKTELLELIRTELSAAGYRVHVAASGEEGLEKARKLKPDAIILDIIMPGMDGWEVLRRLRADPELSDISVVVSSMLDDAPRAADFGIDAWLTKPVDTERFAEVLRESVQHAKSDVLVVEDDEGTQELIKTSLRSLDIRVRTVGSGEDALKALEDRVPEVMVLDLGLPDMSGFELVGRLRASDDWKDLRIVVYTGAELSDDERKRLQGDLVAVVQKHSSSGVHGMVELVAAAVGE